MRFDILVLAFLGVGSLTLTAAADPAPATQPERAAAPAAAVTDSAPHATSAATGVPAPPSASSPAPSAPGASKATAPQLSVDEQRLINLGYKPKPELRNGEKIYCRREAALGSRIPAGQHCGTVAELATTTREGREGLEKTQRNGVNPMPH
jgi:hypothetical protein